MGSGSEGMGSRYRVPSTVILGREMESSASGGAWTTAFRRMPYAGKINGVAHRLMLIAMSSCCVDTL